MQLSQGKGYGFAIHKPLLCFLNTGVWHMLVLIRRYTFNHSRTVPGTWNLQKRFQRCISSWENCWSYLSMNLLNCKNHEVTFGRHGNVLWWHHHHAWTLMNFWFHPWRFHDFFIYQSLNCFHVLFQIIGLLFVLIGVSMYFSEFQNFIELISGSKVFYSKNRLRAIMKSPINVLECEQANNWSIRKDVVKARNENR